MRKIAALACAGALISAAQAAADNDDDTWFCVATSHASVYVEACFMDICARDIYDPAPDICVPAGGLVTAPA